MRSPVLFIVFNRPDTTQEVFNAIREARPSRLYVAADGTRTSHEGELEICEKVRKIATAVDWPCELYTLFRDTNLGCRFAPQTAIDWFFDNEKEGIILEDDCLPHLDFFAYCDWALDTYRDNKKIWHINGNNFDYQKKFPDSQLVSFTSVPQVWGWASWSDRWSVYEGNPFYLHESSQDNYLGWNLSVPARINKMHHIKYLKQGLDAWDYQWQATILNNNGLCLSCGSNLISNLGDGPDATHTQKDTRVHLKTSELGSELKYVEPSFNRSLNRWYESHMGLGSIRSAFKIVISDFFGRLKSALKSIVSGILFYHVTPVVVSSTGRNGSTMLFNAISESLVYHRFKVDPDSYIGRMLVRLSQTYTDRVSDVRLTGVPLHKTHGFLPKKINNRVRFIFVYGDPFESVQSVETMVEEHGRIWFDHHLYHLESHGSYDDIYTSDVLNYEKQMDSWLGNSDENVFGIHYNQIWDRSDELTKFLSFKVMLPGRQSRIPKSKMTDYNIGLFEHLNSVMKKYVK